MKTSIPALILPGLILLGCSQGAAPGSPAPTPQGEGSGESSLMVAAGYGTLLQDAITPRLEGGSLQIKVTPLEEWVIRLTAPDTYNRLQGLGETYGPRAALTAMAGDASLFLVSLFSYQPDVTYEPEELLLVNRGLRFRPLGIAPITPSWGTQRLAQQETRMAIYAFDESLDLTADLVVEYKMLRNDGWREQILPLLDAERAKVRARGGR